MQRALVVGGGIIGTMHAYFFHQAGLEVVQFEADAAPRKASVRNFGLIWVSGRAPGDELGFANRARDLWEDLASVVPGTGFRAHGSLTVATEPAERKVMEEFANRPDSVERQVSFLEPDEALLCNPAIVDDVLGALWCRRDAIVEPSAALGAVRDYLSGAGHYRFEPRCRVTEVATGGVVDNLGRRWTGDIVVVATGAAHDGLLGSHVAGAPLRRVRLQMLQTAPYPRPLTTSLADADSMRYYPAYRGDALDALPPQSALASNQQLQLLIVQRPGGELTIGDTHLFDEPFDFAVEDEPYDELLQRAGRLLRGGLPPVTRRWAGVYSQVVDDRLYFREEVVEGVWIVGGAGGRGMTCAPAIAEETVLAAGLS